MHQKSRTQGKKPTSQKLIKSIVIMAIAWETMQLLKRVKVTRRASWSDYRRPPRINNLQSCVIMYPINETLITRIY